MTFGVTVLHNMAVFIILFIPTPRTEFVYLLIMQLFCQAVVIINVFQHIMYIICICIIQIGFFNDLFLNFCTQKTYFPKTLTLCISLTHTMYISSA